MKKLSIVLLFIVLLVALGGCKNDEKEPQEEFDPLRPYQTLKDDEFIVRSFKDEEIPFVFMEKLYRLTNYEKTTTGKTVAKVLISYTQVIDNTYRDLNNEKYLLTKSNSSLVKVYHEAYYNDIVKVRDSDKQDFEEISYDEYRGIYGFTPFDYTLEGFILSSDNIISIEKLEDNKYKIALDGNSGVQPIKTQMKKFGNLSGDVNFFSVEMIITMDSDFTPLSIDFESEYEVSYPIIGRAKCHQEYRVVYKIY